MLIRTIAVELAPHQITVTNFGPGAIYTPIDRDVELDAKPNDKILGEIPMRRWGKPEEVAQLAFYLASDDAAYVTGGALILFNDGMLRNAGSLMKDAPGKADIRNIDIRSRSIRSSLHSPQSALSGLCRL
jgi:glucose 1-dehydrogenase